MRECEEDKVIRQSIQRGERLIDYSSGTLVYPVPGPVPGRQLEKCNDHRNAIKFQCNVSILFVYFISILVYHSTGVLCTELL